MSTRVRVIACCQAAIHELRLGIAQFGCVFAPGSEGDRDD